MPAKLTIPTRVQGQDDAQYTQAVRESIKSQRPYLSDDEVLSLSSSYIQPVAVKATPQETQSNIAKFYTDRIKKTSEEKPITISKEQAAKIKSPFNENYVGQENYDKKKAFLYANELPPTLQDPQEAANKVKPTLNIKAEDVNAFKPEMGFPSADTRTPQQVQKTQEAAKELFKNTKGPAPVDFGFKKDDYILAAQQAMPNANMEQKIAYANVLKANDDKARKYEAIQLSKDIADEDFNKSIQLDQILKQDRGTVLEQKYGGFKDEINKSIREYIETPQFKPDVVRIAKEKGVSLNQAAQMALDEKSYQYANAPSSLEKNMQAYSDWAATNNIPFDYTVGKTLTSAVKGLTDVGAMGAAMFEATVNGIQNKIEGNDFNFGNEFARRNAAMQRQSRVSIPQVQSEKANPFTQGVSDVTSMVAAIGAPMSVVPKVNLFSKAKNILSLGRGGEQALQQGLSADAQLAAKATTNANKLALDIGKILQSKPANVTASILDNTIQNYIVMGSPTMDAQRQKYLALGFSEEEANRRASGMTFLTNLALALPGTLRPNEMSVMDKVFNLGTFKEGAKAAVKQGVHFGLDMTGLRTIEEIADERAMRQNGIEVEKKPLQQELTDKFGHAAKDFAVGVLMSTMGRMKYKQSDMQLAGLAEAFSNPEGLSESIKQSVRQGKISKEEAVAFQSFLNTLKPEYDKAISETTKKGTPKFAPAIAAKVAIERIKQKQAEKALEALENSTEKWKTYETDKDGKQVEKTLYRHSDGKMYDYEDINTKRQRFNLSGAVLDARKSVAQLESGQYVKGKLVSANQMKAITEMNSLNGKAKKGQLEAIDANAPFENVEYDVVDFAKQPEIAKIVEEIKASGETIPELPSVNDPILNEKGEVIEGRTQVAHAIARGGGKITFMKPLSTEKAKEATNIALGDKLGETQPITEGLGETDIIAINEAKDVFDNHLEANEGDFDGALKAAARDLSERQYTPDETKDMLKRLNGENSVSEAIVDAVYRDKNKVQEPVSQETEIINQDGRTELESVIGGSENKGEQSEGEASRAEQVEVVEALKNGDKIQWNVFGNEEMGEWTVGEKTKTRGGQDAVILSKTYVESSKDGKTYSKEYADANGIKYDNTHTVEHIVPLSELSEQQPQAPTQYTEAATPKEETSGVSGSALKDVGDTFENREAIEDNLKDLGDDVYYHGSDDISYLSSKEDFNTVSNTKNAESKYVNLTPKAGTAVSYSIRQQRIGEKSGVAAFKLKGKGYTMTNADIKTLKSNADYEAFYDKKKSEGYDFVKVPQDANDIVVLNNNAIEYVGKKFNKDALTKAPTQYTEAATPAKKETSGVSGSALKDVEVRKKEMKSENDKLQKRKFQLATERDDVLTSAGDYKNFGKKERDAKLEEIRSEVKDIDAKQVALQKELKVIEAKETGSVELFDHYSTEHGSTNTIIYDIKNDKLIERENVVRGKTKDISVEDAAKQKFAKSLRGRNQREINEAYTEKEKAKYESEIKDEIAKYKEAPPQYTEAATPAKKQSEGVSGSALKDVGRTAKAVSKRVAVEHAGYEGAKRVTGANENTLELDGYGTVSTSQFINTLVENGRLPKDALKNRHIQLTDEYATKLLNENSDLFPKENTETNKTEANLPTFESAKKEYDNVKEKHNKYLKKDGGLRANTPDNVKKEIEDAYTKMQSMVKQERDKRVSEDKRDTGLIDGIERIKDNTSAFTLVRMAMNRGVIPERQFNEFGKNLLHIIADAKDSHEVTMQTAEIIQDFSQRANVKVDDLLAREIQAAENLKYEPVEEVKATTQYTEAAGVSGSALKDVESTAKALEGVKFNANFNLPLEQTKSPKQVSEAYHKANVAEEAVFEPTEKAAEQTMPKKEPTTKKDVEASVGDMVERTLVSLRLKDSSIDESIKQSFTYEESVRAIDGANKADANASQLIKDVGMDEAVRMAIDGEVKGALQSAILGAKWLEADTNVKAATTPEELSIAQKEYKNILEAIGKTQETSGAANAYWATFYAKNSDLGLTTEDKIARWEKISGQVASAEIREAYEKLDAKNKEQLAEIKKLKEQLESEALQEYIDEIKARNKPKSEKPKETDEQRRQRISDRLFSIAEKVRKSETSGLTLSSPIPPHIISDSIKLLGHAAKGGEKIADAMLRVYELIENSIGKKLSDSDKSKVEKYFNDIVKESELPEVDTTEPLSTAVLKELVFKGYDTPELLFAKVKEFYPKGTSDRDIRDSITNYGKEILETQSEIGQKVSAIKSVWGKLSQLEDALSGKLPFRRSAPENKQFRDERRRLTNELKEAMKNLDVPDVPMEDKWQTRIEASKKRYQNAIADYEKAIEDGEMIVRNKAVKLTDRVIEELKRELSLIKEGYNDVFGEEPISLGEKKIQELEKRLAAIGKEKAKEEKSKPEYTASEIIDIEDLENQIAARRKAVKMEGAELKAEAEKNIEKLQKRLDDIRFGAEKRESTKRELTQEEKDLVEQIKDEKAKQGSQKAKRTKEQIKIEAVDTAIDRVESLIKNNELEIKRNPKQELSLELQAKKEVYDSVKKELLKAREEAGIVEKEQLRKRAEYLEKRNEYYKNRQKTGDYSKKKRKKSPTSERINKLLGENDLLKFEEQKLMYQAEQQALSKWGKARNLIADIWNIPRIQMATGELSFIGVQGRRLSGSYLLKDPKVVKEAIKTMWKAMGSKEGLAEVMSKIKNDDPSLYHAMKASKLDLTETSFKVAATEENTQRIGGAFLWNIVMNNAIIPLAKGVDFITGKDVATIAKELKEKPPYEIFERGAVAYNNYLRAKSFTDFDALMKMDGKSFETNEKEYKLLANYLNTATGRGKLPLGLESQAELLAKLLFSPRNFSSELQLSTTPFGIGKLASMQAQSDMPLKNLTKEVSAVKEAAKHQVRYQILQTGLGLTLTGILYGLMGSTDDNEDGTGVELDPRSTKFGSITFEDGKIVDFFNGGLRYAILASRIGSQKYKTADKVKMYNDTPYYQKGQLKDLGEGYIPDGFDLFMQIAANKVNPSLGTAFKIYKAKPKTELDKAIGVKRDRFGNRVDFETTFKELMMPIYFTSIKESIQNDPSALDVVGQLQAFLALASYRNQNKEKQAREEQEKVKKDLELYNKKRAMGLIK